MKFIINCFLNIFMIMKKSGQQKLIMILIFYDKKTYLFIFEKLLSSKTKQKNGKKIFK